MTGKEFTKLNQTYPVYKGSWDRGFKKITYWLHDGSRVVLPASENEKIKPIWATRKGKA